MPQPRVNSRGLRCAINRLEARLIERLLGFAGIEVRSGSFGGGELFEFGIS